MKPPAVLVAFALVASAAAHAQVSVAQAWVPTTAQRQGTAGAYMTITSVQGGKLVAASSPVAASVEIHETAAGRPTKMRALDVLPLPAGRPVALRPGATHLVLLGLKSPVRFGDVVPIRLVVEDAQGRRETVDVKATAKLVLQD